MAVGALVAATRTGTSRKRFMHLDTGAGHQLGRRTHSSDPEAASVAQPWHHGGKAAPFVQPACFPHTVGSEWGVDGGLCLIGLVPWRQGNPPCTAYPLLDTPFFSGWENYIHDTDNSWVYLSRLSICKDGHALMCADLWLDRGSFRDSGRRGTGRSLQAGSRKALLHWRRMLRRQHCRNRCGGCQLTIRMAVTCSSRAPSPTWTKHSFIAWQ